MWVTLIRVVCSCWKKYIPPLKDFQYQPSLHSRNSSFTTQPPICLPPSPPNALGISKDHLGVGLKISLNYT